MSDDLDGVFDELTPEDFIRDTSAFKRTSIKFNVNRLDEFERFLLNAMSATHKMYEAGYPSFSSIVTQDEMLLFRGDDDEDIGHYIARLRREIESLDNVTWCYVTVPSNGGVRIDDRAIDYAVMWYAEAANLEVVRWGLFEPLPDDPDKLDVGWMSTPDGTPYELFTSLMKA